MKKKDYCAPTANVHRLRINFSILDGSIPAGTTDTSLENERLGDDNGKETEFGWN